MAPADPDGSAAPEGDGRPLGAVERYVRLLGSCVVLGAGIALLLRAALGSDGYSSFTYGVVETTGLPFFAVNLAVGVALVLLGWVRGRRPGVGTVTQPLVVGLAISLGLAVVPEPAPLAARLALLALSLPMIVGGLAGYLGTDTGAGPAEAAALAWDPPVPFRWSYGLVQGGGALGGWLLGAPVGPGTLVSVFVLGPAVDAVLARFPVFAPTGRSAADAPDTPDGDQAPSRP